MSHLTFPKCIHFSLFSKIWGHSPPSGEQYFHLVGVNSPVPSFTRGLNCCFIVFLTLWLNKAWVSLLPSFSGLFLSVQRDLADPVPMGTEVHIAETFCDQSLKISLWKLIVTHNRLNCSPLASSTCSNLVPAEPSVGKRHLKDVRVSVSGVGPRNCYSYRFKLSRWVWYLAKFRNHCSNQLVILPRYPRAHGPLLMEIRARWDGPMAKSNFLLLSVIHSLRWLLRTYWESHSAFR